MTDRRDEAVAVLRENRHDGYTIPSATLYPYQWNWDSAFIALGLAHVDPAAAKRELRTLLGSMWPNGMVPQIAFWVDAEGYFPGPDEWDAGTDDVQTSGITQPPMLVPAARHVYEVTGDDDFRDELLPLLDQHLSWWVDERSFDGDTVYVRHPWATGMDDSPAWLSVLESFEPSDIADDLDYVREDRKSEDLSEQRPTDWDYDRYVALVRQGKALDWDEARLRQECPFLVEDVLTNSIFVRGCEDLAALYASAGDDDKASEWRRQAEHSRAGMRERLWDEEMGTFVSYDRVNDRPLRVNSVAGLVSVFGEVPTNEQFGRLRENLRENFLGYDYACPSYVGPEMDLDRYWRGPVWMNVNWLLVDGLRRYGATDLADRIEADSLELLEREGFREYFNPETGAGRGSDRFSWSAALYLDWTSHE
jgi:neutral trehalase